MTEQFGPILLKQGATYRKIGRAFFKKGVAGEIIDTIIDGKVETTRMLKEGDWIVRADTSAAERYSMSDANFKKRYQTQPVPFDDHPDAAELKAEGFQAFEPCGRCLALVADASLLAKYLPGGRFTAPWNSPMLVEEGDALVATAPPGGQGKPTEVTDIYRIEKSAFAETYEKE
eukprot:CAMPEP_0172685902 /NCGR_PEP_ID=MMETSP1074-20121228/20568_1 /TAXON_ID=2916 /ORGANISM="Ceratium fusus, Strain PA161109" /LENGTH=173 /DNA_ID=CAMNT_0013505133 /DNA_START=51 /DNA_END=572 /DNA_ORIENTATION=-